MNNLSSKIHRSHQAAFTQTGIIVLVVAAIIIAGSVYLFAKGESKATVLETKGPQTFAKVERGQLVVSVNVGGNIRATEAEIVKNEVEGRVRILSLIEAGTVVKEGDLLIQLDDSDLRDLLIDQQIMVQNSEADYVEARETEVVRKNKAQADVETAELTLQLAKIDLDKYKEADFPLAKQKAMAAITISREEKARAAEKLKWSVMLEKEGYITQTEREADELAEKKADLDLQSAQSELKVLEDFTYRRTIAKLESDIKQAEMLVLRSKAEKIAEDVDSTSDTKARHLRWKREADKLKKIQDQIAKCTIKAPCDGMVVYAGSDSRRGREEPLEEGTEVYERQELIRLPKSGSMSADIKIHESSLQKVNVGMEVLVTTDAMPGKVFQGTIKSISSQPDTQSRWLNPDLKVYNAEVSLLNTENSGLRPGMSCRAEVIVKVFPNTLYVPVQSAVKIDGSMVVYVNTPNGPVARKVKTGLDNNSMVQVIDGVSVGEEILMNPPLPQSIKGSTQTKRINRMSQDELNTSGRTGGSKPAEKPAAGSKTSKPDQQRIPVKSPGEKKPNLSRKPAGGNSGS